MKNFVFATATVIALGLSVVPAAYANAIAYDVSATIQVTDENRGNLTYNVGVTGSFTYDTTTQSESNVSLVLTNAYDAGGSIALNSANACSFVYVCQSYAASFATAPSVFDPALILYPANQDLSLGVDTGISDAEVYINYYGTNDSVVAGQFTVAPVPEPGSLLLLGAGLAGLGMIRRKAA